MMIKQVRLSVKLILAFLLVGIVPFAILAFLSLQNTSTALQKQVFGQLQSLREVKKTQIDDYFRIWSTQLIVAASGDTAKALTEFRVLRETGFGALSDVWEAQSMVYQQSLDRYPKEFGWGDFYLILNDGYIIYSTKRRNDLGKMIDDPLLKSSSLARVFEDAKDISFEQAAISDFIPYAPADGAPAAFMIAKVKDEMGVHIGYVAMEMAIGLINKVMMQREGLGTTGETYLVGTDTLMRSDSYLDPVNHSVKSSFANPDKGRVVTKSVQLALGGLTGETISKNYLGKTVLAAYTPLKVGRTVWALVAEREMGEAFTAVTAIRNIVGLIAIVGISAIIFVALLITGSITRPISRIIKSLSDGAQQTTSAAGQVSSASQHLSQNASEQAASLEQTSSSIDEINTRTKQTTDNTTKVHELSQKAYSAAEEGNKIVGQMQGAMNEINDSSSKISKIIKTIEEIAFQTNLLALNAAVEAARAGEHGKGFAVVAEEVRNLAKRSATAAKDTASLIEDNVHKAKNGTQISQKVSESLNHIMEQSKKVLEIIGQINNDTMENAEGIAMLTKAIVQLNSVTQQNASAAEETASSSEELTAQAEALQDAVYHLQALVGGNGQQKDVTASIPHTGKERRESIGVHIQGGQGGFRPGRIERTGLKITNPEDVIPLDDDKKKPQKGASHDK